RRCRIAPDMWTAMGAFSVRLLPGDTRSRDGLRQRCAENHVALVDSGRYQIAVPRPPFSAIRIRGRHDRFGSSSLSLWRELSVDVGTPHRDDGASGKV